MASNIGESDSDSWTLLSEPSNQETNVDNHKGSDSSEADSTEFVKVEDLASVSYHHLSDEPEATSTPDVQNEQSSPFQLNLSEHGEETSTETCEEADPPLPTHSTDDAPKPDSTSDQQNQEDGNIVVETLSAKDQGLEDHDESFEVENRADAPTDKHVTDSDSDHSDFVRLDPYLAEVEDKLSGDNIMRLSDISSASSPAMTSSTSSALSASFRFIHRSGMVLGAEQYVRRRLHHDNDTDSVQSDVDDRCESDISGVADDDLSSASLGDLPIAAGDVMRSYRHKPNANLNRTLTTIALLVLCAAVGIAIGHYLGTRTEGKLRRQQVENMQNLSDEYLMCLQREGELEDRIVGHQQNIGGDEDALKETLVELERERELVRRECLVSAPSTEQAIVPFQDTQKPHQEPLSQPRQESVPLLPTVVDYSQEENPESLDDHIIMESHYDLDSQSELQDKAHLLQDWQGEYIVCDLEKEKNVDNRRQETEEPEVNLEENEPVVRSQGQKLELHGHELERMGEDLEKAKRDSQPWYSLFKLETERDSATEDDTHDRSVRSYLSALLGNAVDEFRSGLQTMKEISHNHTKALISLTKDAALATNVKEKWGQLKGLLDSRNLRSRTQKAQALYNEMYDSVKTKVMHLMGSDSPAAHDNSATVPNTESSELPNESSAEEEKPSNGRFEKVINKTKQSVQKLSEKINETWHQVKEIPTVLYHNVAPKIEEESKSIVAKIESGWEKVKKKVNTAWFKNEAKENKRHNEEKDKIKNGKRKSHFHGDKADHKQYHGDPYWNSADDDIDEHESSFPKPSAKSEDFENKPDHKQRHSSTTATKHKKTKQQHNEFWDAVGFDPDDVFYDGFFEGQERKWRKHEGRIRKLHGRVRRLSEELLQDADDDEMDDLLDDLYDEQEELEDRDPPRSLVAWLACQTRWWKARFQRKHRSEDLLLGCDRQLMHWQMRSSCTPCSKDKQACKEQAKVIQESPTCQHFLSVIEKTESEKTPGSDKYGPKNKPKQGNKNHAYRNNKKLKKDSDKQETSEQTESLKNIGTGKIDPKNEPKERNKNHAKKNEKKIKKGSDKQEIPKNEQKRDNKKHGKKHEKKLKNGSDKRGESVESVTISLPSLPQVDSTRNETTPNHNHMSHVENQPKYGPENKPKNRKHQTGNENEVEASPDWLFARREDLEYRLHKTDWMYRRAQDRDFSRKRPGDWYHERARGRETRHSQLVGRK